MKIAIINMVDYGSTGRIMFQIADCARKNNFQVLTYSKKWRRKQNIHPFHSYYGYTIENAINVILTRLFGFQGSFSYFGTRKLIKWLKKYNPDIIHIHNLHDSSTCLPVFFKYIKKYNKKLVWTLHDCWSITGGCYHFQISKCNKWQSGCRKCQYLNHRIHIDDTKYMWNKKKKWYSGIDNLVIVTPSEWLKEIVKKSFLAKHPIKVINNGIDLTTFTPQKSAFKKENNIKGYMILAVSNIWNYNKGLDVVISLARELPNTYTIVIVGTNNEIDKELPSNVISIHRTNDINELVKIYSSADVFINPTREDTFPTVNIEALACGIPVITFNTGGSPECLNSKCGRIVKENSHIELKKEIIKICENKIINKKDCIAQAKKYDRNINYQKYIELYEEIYNKDNGGIS